MTQKSPRSEKKTCVKQNELQNQKVLVPPPPQNLKIFHHCVPSAAAVAAAPPSFTNTPLLDCALRGRTFNVAIVFSYVARSFLNR